MNTQKQFLEYADAVASTIAPLGVSDNGLAELKARIGQAELIVPVVGGFSAGKSTLLNSFMGNDILPTAVTPETALATELRYSETDYIEAVGESGQLERYALADFPQLKDNARKFKNLRLYLNNENLKAIQPLVLVDMPGFDAPIENHNQAILTYLERGVYFVFLTSVEDGNITLSMKREIENLQGIGKGFAFCISKTNLRPEEDVAAVQEKIAEQLEDDFDHTDEVVLLDLNSGGNLKKILQAIDPEALFRALFEDELRNNNEALTQSINVKISTFKSNQAEIAETLKQLEESLSSIESKKDAAIADVENRYGRSSLNVVNQAVVSAILSQKARLVDLALHNQSGFEREVSDITKNALIHALQNRFQTIARDLTEELGKSISAHIGNIDVGNSLGSMALDLCIKNSQLINQKLNAGLQVVAAMITAKVASQSLKLLLGGLVGLVGAVLAFLPEILSWLNKSGQEQRQREHIEQQIVSNVIPQIQQQLNSVLPELLNTQIRELIQNISEQFEVELQQKRAEIQAAEAEKAAKAAELESMIGELNQGKQQLLSLATQYLFVRD